MNKMLKKFRMTGSNRSVNLHFLHSHIDRFHEYLGEVRNRRNEQMKNWKLDKNGKTIIADY